MAVCITTAAPAKSKRGHWGDGPGNSRVAGISFAGRKAEFAQRVERAPVVADRHPGQSRRPCISCSAWLGGESSESLDKLARWHRWRIKTPMVAGAITRSEERRHATGKRCSLCTPLGVFRFPTPPSNEAGAFFFLFNSRTAPGMCIGGLSHSNPL
jgi:hypothetical protein